MIFTPPPCQHCHLTLVDPSILSPNLTPPTLHLTTPLLDPSYTYQSNPSISGSINFRGETAYGADVDSMKEMFTKFYNFHCGYWIPKQKLFR